MTGPTRSLSTADRAFTLIEMLVVFGIIALLALVLLPVLGTVRRHATGSVCLANQKQLVAAWSMYHTDNSDCLVGGATSYKGPQAVPWRWVERPLFSENDNPENDPVPDKDQMCRDYRFNGIRAGRLFTYLSDETLYHCPGSPEAQDPEPYAFWRTYSIAGLMNGQDYVYRKNGLYSEISDYSYALFPGGEKTLVCVTRYHQIIQPAAKYVFVEEKIHHNETYNLGSFMLMQYAESTCWWDYPSNTHNNRSSLGFADGHVEMHHWTDPRTRTLMKEGYKGITVKQPDNTDLQWMIEGYIPRP